MKGDNEGSAPAATARFMADIEQGIDVGATVELHSLKTAKVS